MNKLDIGLRIYLNQRLSTGFKKNKKPYFIPLYCFQTTQQFFLLK